MVTRAQHHVKRQPGECVIRCRAGSYSYSNAWCPADSRNITAFEAAHDRIQRSMAARAHYHAFAGLIGMRGSARHRAPGAGRRPALRRLPGCPSRRFRYAGRFPPGTGQFPCPGGGGDRSPAPRSGPAAQGQRGAFIDSWETPTRSPAASNRANTKARTLTGPLAWTGVRGDLYVVYQHIYAGNGDNAATTVDALIQWLPDACRRVEVPVQPDTVVRSGRNQDRVYCRVRAGPAGLWKHIVADSASANPCSGDFHAGPKAGTGHGWLRYRDRHASRSARCHEGGGDRSAYVHELRPSAYTPQCRRGRGIPASPRPAPWRAGHGQPAGGRMRQAGGSLRAAGMAVSRCRCPAGPARPCVGRDLARTETVGCGHPRHPARAGIMGPGGGFSGVPGGRRPVRPAALPCPFMHCFPVSNYR
jgi:hypothetical protein